MKAHQTFRDRRFVNSSEVPDDIIRVAEDAEKKEERLFDLVLAGGLDEAIQEALAANIAASWELEGESLDSDVVKSYVIASMGMKVSDWMETDWTQDEETDYVPREQRAVQSIMACLNERPLDHETVFETNGLAQGTTIKSYRNHPEFVMRGREVAYEAPEEKLVPALMDNFLEWWNGDRLKLPNPVGAAIAHYNFVAIHPFRDGNGRTARALMEKALIRSRETVFRPYSLSAQILKEKGDYYRALATGDPFIFVRYVLDMQGNAMDKGLAEAQRLGFLRLFFKRDAFSHAEKEIIAKMSMHPDAEWEARDFYLAGNAEEAFAGLREKGVVTCDGKINLEYRPEHRANPLADPPFPL